MRPSYLDRFTDAVISKLAKDLTISSLHDNHQKASYSPQIYQETRSRIVILRYWHSRIVGSMSDTKNKTNELSLLGLPTHIIEDIVFRLRCSIIEVEYITELRLVCREFTDQDSI